MLIHCQMFAYVKIVVTAFYNVWGSLDCRIVCTQLTLTRLSKKGAFG